MQENPTIYALVWLGGIVITVTTISVGGAFAADERYMKKADAELAIQVQAKQADETRKLIEYQSDAARKKQLEDNIFMFNLKKEKDKTTTDKAMVERYKQERQDMMDRWQREGRPLK
jgi:hypothetical protein